MSVAALVSLVSPSLELLVPLDSLVVPSSAVPVLVVSSFVGLDGAASAVFRSMTMLLLWAVAAAGGAVAGKVDGGATVPLLVPLASLCPRRWSAHSFHMPPLLFWLPLLPRW